MRTWTATATADANPAAILSVLTDPDAASQWAPVPFDVEDDRRLAAGRTSRVSGRLAGKRVGFDVHVHAADVTGLAQEIREAISKPRWARTGEAGSGHKAPLTATGPVGLDVDYRLAPTARGAEVHASISVRPNRGLAGRLLAEATSALLNAGALDQTLARLTRAAATA